MLAWQVETLTGTSGMRLIEKASPAPGSGQVQVKVAAAALNFLDTLMTRGEYQLKPELPFTPGVELAGTVTEVGPGVALRVGDRICGLVDYGAFAEYALADATAMLPVPDDVDLIEASTIPVVYPTAYCALKLRANMQPAEFVVVHAGAGGMGIACIQLAKAWGGRVIATAGGEEKCEICRAEGAELAIDYLEKDWVDEVKSYTEGHRADVIVDMVGGEITQQSLKSLAWSARLVIVGFAGGTIPDIAANRLLLKNASAMGVMWGGYRRRQPDVFEETFAEIFALYRQGQFKPVISERYPLDQAVAAINALGNRRTHGKVVLIP